jgi:3-isopropylmalate/(R)-2-methylmalate dehydratase small subunit
MARAWVYGDHISTDDIIAGRYLAKHDPKEWGRHAMENIDSEFVKKVKKGDILIAGRNFGCGSSREQAPIALKEAGISAVVAESFARIFYRNAINQGLPVLISPGISKGFKNSDPVEINLKAGVIRNRATGKDFKAQPIPDFVLKILEAGGLVPYMKRKFSER